MLLWGLFVLAGQKIHLKFMLGSGSIAFSWISVMVPVTFFLFSISRSALLGGSLWFITHKAFSLTLGIPTLFASLLGAHPSIKKVYKML